MLTLVWQGKHEFESKIFSDIDLKEQRRMKTLEKNWYFFVLKRSITGPQVKGSRHNS
jgi:hypothetical protein